MANDNNKINNLVTNDDDLTAELELPAFARLEFDAEADARTYKPDEHDVRESQTVQINKELSSSHNAIARKDKLIRKRDRKIKALKSEIRQRDENYRQLKSRVDDSLLAVSEDDSAIDPDSNRATSDLISRLHRAAEYADAIRQQSHDLSAKNTHAEREIDSLSNQLAAATERNVEITEGISSASSEVEELQSTLNGIQKLHEEEIRILRFELGSAQTTVVEAEEISSQMVSDLIDAQSFRGELEKMLGDAEEQSSERIKQLEKEASRLSAKVDSFEQKLTAKSEAISTLLAELAKKPERFDAVGEIKGVIQDIDSQISARSSRTDRVGRGLSGDRISRVLIGTVNDQMLRFPLFKNRLTIGRTEDNDIQLKAVYVSRRHAVIQTDGDVTRIIDWGSKNGICVNSAKVSEHFLCHGDTIAIGNARFRYEERRKRNSQ